MINITKPFNQYETELCQLKIYPSSSKIKDLLNPSNKLLKNKSTTTLDFTPNRTHSVLNYFSSSPKNIFTPIFKKKKTKIKSKLTKTSYLFSLQFSPFLKANMNYKNVSSSPKNIRPKSNINSFNNRVKPKQANFIIKNQNNSFFSANKRKKLLEIDHKFKYENIMNNLRLKYHGNILLTKNKLYSYLFNQGLLINYRRNKIYLKNMFSMSQDNKIKENKSNNEIRKIRSLFKNEMIKDSMNESKDKSGFSLVGTFMNKNGEIEKIQNPKKLKIYNYRHLKKNK